MGFKSEVREKLDHIVHKQSEHTTELAVYNQSLKEHMRRTDIAEKALHILEDRVSPVEHHIMFVNRSVKVFIGLLAGISTALTIYHYLVK